MDVDPARHDHIPPSVEGSIRTGGGIRRRLDDLPGVDPDVTDLLDSVGRIDDKPPFDL
jgi:hypothetical protein